MLKAALTLAQRREEIDKSKNKKKKKKLPKYKNIGNKKKNSYDRTKKSLYAVIKLYTILLFLKKKKHIKTKNEQTLKSTNCQHNSFADTDVMTAVWRNWFVGWLVIWLVGWLVGWLVVC